MDIKKAIRRLFGKSYDVVYCGGECPKCQENRIDYLEIDETEHVTCLSCGNKYSV